MPLASRVPLLAPVAAAPRGSPPRAGSLGMRTPVEKASSGKPGEAFVLQGAGTAIAVSLTEETTAAVVDRMAALAPRRRPLRGARRLRARPRPGRPAEGPDEADPLHLPLGVGGRPVARRRPRLEAPRCCPRPSTSASTSWTWRLVPASPTSSRRRRGAGSCSRGTTSRARRTISTAIYDRMAAQQPDVVKIAVTARSVADLGRLLAFASRRAADRRPAARRPRHGPARRRLADPRRPLRRALSRSPRRRAAARPRPGSCRPAALAGTYRVRSISPSTRVYGLLGSDVLRSLSPAIQNRAFAERGHRRRLRAAAGGVDGRLRVGPARARRSPASA